MGALTESFSNLTEMLLADRQHSASRAADRELLLSRVLRPFLPSSIRCGPGTLVDLKDRHLGPFDVVACWEAYPPLGDGRATIFPADGAVFCLQARNWAVDDITQFAAMASGLRLFERRRNAPIVCAGVSFDPLPIDQVLDLLRSPAGQAIDGVLSVGQHVVIRNAQGWYGDPDRVPFVTERNGPEALKAFTLFLVHLTQSFVGMPFGLADYQHL
jgi:hypothetical protein